MGIEVDDLLVRFPTPRGDGERVVLDHVDMTVAPGEFVAVVGPSGCGKTTLLNCIAGLLPYDGRVAVGGVPVTRPGAERAVVFQSASLFPWKTALRNVTYGLEVRGVRATDARQSARDIIRLVGLEGYEDYKPAQLSGGMQQRVNLARALVTDPAVVLLDEPFAALDAQTRELMQLELIRVWREQRKTMVLITHQIDEAVFLASRIFVMSRRPARIARVIDVPFGEDRDLLLKRTTKFTSIVENVWELIEKDAREALADAH